MSRVLSFRDFKLIPEMAKYNEIELLHPAMDETVNSYLCKVGFDTDYEITYIPTLHRDMQNTVAVGFQFVGELSINRGFVNSSMCSITERLAAAAYTDPSLTRELAGMLGCGLHSYYTLAEVDAEDQFNEESDTEESYEWVSQQLRQLESIRDQIRGKKTSQQ